MKDADKANYLCIGSIVPALLSIFLLSFFSQYAIGILDRLALLLIPVTGIILSFLFYRSFPIIKDFDNYFSKCWNEYEYSEEGGDS